MQGALCPQTKPGEPADPFQLLLPVELLELRAGNPALPLLLRLQQRHEARTPDPMLPLGLFRRRNFAVGTVQTLSMYGGLSITFFFLVLYLQQVAGYDALQAGLATLPATLVMFALSRRFGGLVGVHRREGG